MVTFRTVTGEPKDDKIAPIGRVDYGDDSFYFITTKKMDELASNCNKGNCPLKNGDVLAVEDDYGDRCPFQDSEDTVSCEGICKEHWTRLFTEGWKCY